jgi:hypothetical protein
MTGHPDGPLKGALEMPSTKKRPQSPTNDEPPQKCPKTITQAQIVSPKKRSHGSKDQRLMALRKLSGMRWSNIFKSRPSKLGAVQPTRSTTTGVGCAIVTVDHASQSPNLSPIISHSPPSLPINDDSFVFEETNNTPGSPDGTSRTGSETPPGNI